MMKPYAGIHVYRGRFVALVIAIAIMAVMTLIVVERLLGIDSTLWSTVRVFVTVVTLGVSILIINILISRGRLRWLVRGDPPPII